MWFGWRYGAVVQIICSYANVQLAVSSVNPVTSKRCNRNLARRHIWTNLSQVHPCDAPAHVIRDDEERCEDCGEGHGDHVPATDVNCRNTGAVHEIVPAPDTALVTAARRVRYASAPPTASVISTISDDTPPTVTY